jgi:glycogen synthase
MRVLLLGPYPPPHGGVETNVVAIRSFLLKRGIPCAVINITRHRKAEADEIYYPKGAGQLLRLLVRLRYDLLHLHVGGLLSRRVLRLGLTCSLIPCKRTVFTFHSGGYPSTPQGRSTDPHSFDGLVLRRFDRLIAVNEEILQFFLKLGVPHERVRVIAPHSFPEGESYAGPLPEPLATFFTEHRPVFISAGQLEPEYDLPIQIEALARVRASFPNAGLVLLGHGSLEQDLRNRIEADLSAADILLSGDIPHAAAMQAISRADLMLRTTLYDGDAISVREALHLGTPVIATDNGMRPADVRLVPTSSVQALQQAIEQTLMASAGRARKQSAADESNLEAVLDLYRELLD